MNNPCTFYLVRHAESEHNAGWKNGTLTVHTTGGALGSDLSQLGIQQAEERAKDFVNIHFDAIFSSDFLRAKHTADILISGQNAEIYTTPLLEERYWGSLEGQSTKDIHEKTMQLQEKMTDDEKMQFKLVPDAESDGEAAIRMMTFLQETAPAYRGKIVLVISHGNIMRRFLNKIRWAKYDELPGLTIENTGYFVLPSDGVEFEVKKTVGIHRKW